MLRFITLLLVIIGGLNWALVGAFRFDLVERILGVGVQSDIVYIVVGISAVVQLVIIQPPKQ